VNSEKLLSGITAWAAKSGASLVTSEDMLFLLIFCCHIF
jgi:hypothetical protein